jgi:hypothetical protein
VVAAQVLQPLLLLLVVLVTAQLLPGVTQLAAVSACRHQPP